MWVLIDNYDSFTYILHHYLLQLHDDIKVYKNDEVTSRQLKEMQPEAIVISPGPGKPAEAGVTMEAIEQFIGVVPILGVCLGHQALGEYLGAKLAYAQYPMHGKQSSVEMAVEAKTFGLTEEMTVMRYHSLVLTDFEGLNQLTPLGYATDDGSLMLFCSPAYKCFGIQFHPESIGTTEGMQLLEKWYRWAF